jgi:hypothetical protein
VFDKTASNPQARMAQAVSAFRRAAPAVVLHLHVDTIQGIEPKSGSYPVAGSASMGLDGPNVGAILSLT